MIVLCLGNDSAVRNSEIENSLGLNKTIFLVSCRVLPRSYALLLVKVEHGNGVRSGGGSLVAVVLVRSDFII